VRNHQSLLDDVVDTINKVHASAQIGYEDISINFIPVYDLLPNFVSRTDEIPFTACVYSARCHQESFCFKNEGNMPPILLQNQGAAHFR
jgi:hypothetical protein